MEEKLKEKRTLTFKCSECKKPYEVVLDRFVERKIFMKIVKDGVCERCTTRIVGERNGNGNSEAGY